MSGEPIRFADGAGGELLREAIEGARSELPGPSAVDAAFARFPLAGPAGGPGGSGGGPSVPPALPGAAATSALGAALKTGAAIVVAGAVGVGAWAGLRPEPERPREAPVPAQVAPPAQVMPVSAAPSPSPATDPLPEAVASTTPTPPPRSKPAPSPAPADGRSEMDVLREAQAALSSSPARALALTTEHQQRFPRGGLGQERDMIRVQALLALGRAGEARALADDFRRRHPTSAHNARLDDLFPR